MQPPSFAGFSPETVRFLTELEQNNDKLWFEANRQRFEGQLMEPARDFVVALGARLREIAPEVQADPRTDRSIFRLHRDTRFSPDKSPYKSHLGLWFWEGPGHRMSNPGFYFHLEPPNLMVAAGLHVFPKPFMEAYRRAVVDPQLGSELEAAVRAIVAHETYAFSAPQYKKTPRGFDPDHPRQRWLLHSGLSAGVEMEIPAWLYGSQIVDECMRRYAELLPLHRWLVRVNQTLEPETI